MTRYDIIVAVLSGILGVVVGSVAVTISSIKDTQPAPVVTEAPAPEVDWGFRPTFESRDGYCFAVQRGPYGRVQAMSLVPTHTCGGK